MFANHAYAHEIEAIRQQKDRFFRASPESPLSYDDRRSFDGLRYFSPDASWRIEATVEPSLRTIVEIQTSHEHIRQYERYAFLHFTVGRTVLRLTAFRPLQTHAHSHDDEIALFVPFRDALAGQETYGAGRYLDVEASEGETLILDFNLAYNPYCAYSDQYVCPMTPPENVVSIPVRAGEKIFHHS